MGSKESIHVNPPTFPQFRLKKQYKTGSLNGVLFCIQKVNVCRGPWLGLGLDSNVWNSSFSVKTLDLAILHSRIFLSQNSQVPLFYGRPSTPTRTCEGTWKSGDAAMFTARLVDDALVQVQYSEVNMSSSHPVTRPLKRRLCVLKFIHIYNIYIYIYIIHA